MASHAPSLAKSCTSRMGNISCPLASDPRRPLYLGVRLKGRVDTDGPALRVRAAGRAEARFPLSRVSRVIASPRVDWGAGALRACMDNGVPIVIVGDDGEPLGSFHPAQPRATRLAEDIEEFVDRPDWREFYEVWLRAERMRVLREWRNGRSADDAAVDARKFGELARMYVYGADAERPLGECGGRWRGALHALAAVAIRRAGVQPVHWGSGGQALNVLRDLASLLELRLRLEVREGIEHGLEGEATVLLVFRVISEDLEMQAHRSLGSLARRVRQVLAEWR